jgi:hypothetical protein
MNCELARQGRRGKSTPQHALSCPSCHRSKCPAETSGVCPFQKVVRCAEFNNGSLGLSCVQPGERVQARSS